MSVETAPATAASTASESGEQSTDGRGLRWLLVVCCVAQFMVILDLSIVNVALPNIQLGLNFSAPELQWVVDAYAIVFAGFLMLGGRWADHYGQRRIFVIGLSLFAVTSLAGGIAPTKDVLIAARGFQGIAGALMAACSLAIITASFEPGPALNNAIGKWATMNGLGGAAGVLFGGIITQFISWRWILLINPPIAIATAVVAWRVVRDRRGDVTRSFDMLGAFTLTLGQIVLVFGIVEAGLKGLDTFAALGPIAVGIVMLIGFVVVETRFAKDPLIPFKELSHATQTANNIVLLFSAALFPMWVLSSLYLQQVLGLSPLDTGLIFLPMTLAILAVASNAGKLVNLFGVRAVLGSGLIMLTSGLLLLAKIAPSGSGIAHVMIPGILAAAGIAMSIVPSTIAATQGSKPGQAGLASGLVNTNRQIGGGLGLAVLITLATQHTTHLLGHGIQVPNALTDGFRLAFLIGAGLAAAAALLTFTMIARPDAEQRGRDRRFAGVIALVVALFAGVTFAFAGNRAAPIGKYTRVGSDTFVTAPNLHPPTLKVDKRVAGASLAPGYIFMTNFYNLSFPPIWGQSGPLIVDRNLQPVWFQPVPEKVVAANLSVQTYEGKPVLVWWQGFVTNTGATESGEWVIANQHYQTIARLKATGGWVLTLHEIVIRGQDAWVTANKNVPHDLSNYGGAYNGALIDSAVQEYNLKTGKQLLNWDALKHISLHQAISSEPTNGFPWDAYHVNSIDVPGDGTFLVSMRNTWAAYLVDEKSGAIRWTLGGRNSSFKFSKGAAFQWQHDVRLGPGSTVSLYDDHCCQITSGDIDVPASGPSRGVVLNLDQQSHTATLAAQYVKSGHFDSDYMGDTQTLPNGNVFVGWGSEPYFSEFDSSGHLIYEGELPGPDLSYRTSIGQWVGLPLTKPSGAARGATVYASWNGATELASWRVLAGAGNGGLAPVATHAKTGFETKIALPRTYAVHELQALDARGRVIGTSAPFGG